MDFIVEGRVLDPQQIECIKKECHNHLVIAGAGTGKTTTIIGKIKYLLSNHFCRPSEILVLSFTNASASEMKERILRETRKYILNDENSETVHVSTFHSFGLSILKTPPISAEIQQFLDSLRNPEDESEIEFDKMIRLATLKIWDGYFVHPFKYIIVDEYQDISYERYQLLRLLRETRDYNLFCVGDDWQSIYKFSGSEISLILEFEKYFGKTEISRIETTYRFPQSLVDVSSKFVMENPTQIRKKIKGRADTEFAVMEILGDSVRQDLNFVSAKFNDLPENATVFLIGRFKHDIRNVLACKNLKVTKLSDEEYEIFYAARPDINIRFITAHKSKGLQADYVFIVNCLDKREGFPARIEPDKTEKFPFAEERRLFYVALTRAKKKVFLLTVRGQESIFINVSKSFNLVFQLFGLIFRPC
jgi:superfamily I DNA/RNA helicase